MVMDIPTCPLCGPAQPMEHDAECDDFACPECGLCAPPDVLERIAKMVHADGHAWAMEAQLDTVRELFAAEALAAVDGYVHEAVKVERAVCRARIATLEAELAQFKQPAYVLAEAERLLNGVGYTVLLSELRITDKLRVAAAVGGYTRYYASLAEAYAKLTGGRDG